MLSIKVQATQNGCKNNYFRGLYTHINLNVQKYGITFTILRICDNMYLKSKIYTYILNLGVK